MLLLDVLIITIAAGAATSILFCLTFASKRCMFILALISRATGETQSLGVAPIAR